MTATVFYETRRPGDPETRRPGNCKFCLLVYPVIFKWKCIVVRPDINMTAGTQQAPQQVLGVCVRSVTSHFLFQSNNGWWHTYVVHWVLSQTIINIITCWSVDTHPNHANEVGILNRSYRLVQTCGLLDSFGVDLLSHTSPPYYSLQSC